MKDLDKPAFAFKTTQTHAESPRRTQPRLHTLQDTPVSDLKQVQKYTMHL